MSGMLTIIFLRGHPNWLRFNSNIRFCHRTIKSSQIIHKTFRVFSMGLFTPDCSCAPLYKEGLIIKVIREPSCHLNGLVCPFWGSKGYCHSLQCDELWHLLQMWHLLQSHMKLFRTTFIIGVSLSDRNGSLSWIKIQVKTITWERDGARESGKTIQYSRLQTW